MIRTRIPGILALINRSIDELEAELDHFGRPIAIDAGVRSMSVGSLLMILDNQWCHAFILDFGYFV